MIPFCIIALENDEDREMMTSVYENYWRYLFKIAYAVLRDEDTVNEVIHDTWISWCNPNDLGTIRAKKLRSSFELRIYLAKCVRNKCFSRIEKERKAKSELSLEAYRDYIDLLYAQDNPVEKEADIHSDIEECYQAMRAMSPMIRSIMMLRYYDDMSNKEIALIVKRDEGYVRACLSAGRKKLRRWSNEMRVDEADV